ncbi:MAG TPA: helix-turn-helix transcriptional regulator [Thermomicrobiaceae bacterium]|nr:helix-turn-helix transcriptional regulator [Thermomicrobiaceae bacterium]
MNHRDYVARREHEDAEFHRLRLENRPVFEFQLALIRARQDASLTQQELARLIGTTQSAVAKWENGVNVPRLDTVQRLASVLNVDFEITPDHIHALARAH